MLFYLVLKVAHSGFVEIRTFWNAQISYLKETSDFEQISDGVNVNFTHACDKNAKIMLL